jgi:tetratricopeptide (TPR) repeat protein
MIERTKLDQWCEGVIEAGWLAALVVAPLFFNVFSSRVFEPDKISLVRTIALIMALAWLVKIANGGYGWLPAWSAMTTSDAPSRSESWKNLWRNPFFIPVVLLISAYLISTLASLAPFVSWFGSYQRLQGTFTFLSYMTIALLVAAHLRSPDQVRRLQHAVIVASVPIAIYAVFQHYKLDPLPWGGDTTRRVTANAGNAIFLGAYLLMAFFLTLERIYSSFAALVRPADDGSADVPHGSDVAIALAGGAYLFVALVQSLAIVWTQSRGPWLGMLLGIYLFVLLLINALRPRWYLAGSAVMVGLGVLGLVLIFAMNTLPVFQAWRTVPYLGRFTQLLDQESTTAQVRTLIWQGASDLVSPHEPLVRPDGETDALNAIRPLVGYGPEAMWVAFNKFYPSELAQVEARNASPDRSHNETWDSLVVTGWLGFVAYMAVFLSIFYWALRWLGLLVNRRDTILFASLLALFGLLFSVAFYVYDGQQTRFLGVALPAGLMVGLLAYIMSAAFLHPNFKPDPADIPRQLLIVALLSTIVAHFVEIHFGIAIVATRTYFWIYTALLLTTGLRWSLTQPIAAFLDVGSTNSQTAALLETPTKSKKGKSLPPKSVQRKPLRDLEPLPWTPLTVMTDLLVFLTGVFLFTTNGPGNNSISGILFDSVTKRSSGGQLVSSPFILLAFFFTWLIAVVLGLVVEALRRREMPTASWWIQAALVHAAVVWGGWLTYGLYQASRLVPLQVPAGLSSNEQLNFQLDHVAGHFAVFTWLLVFWVVAAATVLSWRWLTHAGIGAVRRPILSLATAAVGAIAVYAAVSFVNVGLVRADIIYKQGQQFDNQRSWVNSVELYRRALAARESEDHYMLFLGRALLEQAKAVTNPTGTVSFPEQPTLNDVLALQPESVSQMGRQDLLRAAEAVLLNAQNVNPLNTDHTANLARLYRTWADLMPDDPTVRQEMLDKSLAEYQMAVTLSPNAAHLWNEKGNAHLARGEADLAEEAYRQSLNLDPLFEQTYLLLSDLLDNQNRLGEGAELLTDGVRLFEEERGAASTVQLNNYLGVTLSRMGDITGAIGSMQRILDVQPTNMTALRNLALLQRDQGSLSDAAQTIEQAIAVTPVEQTDQLTELRSAALDIYQRIATTNPDDYAVLFRMAGLAQAQGDAATALALAQQALTVAPESAKAEVQNLIATLGGGATP